jgi:hypothetical protein
MYGKHNSWILLRYHSRAGERGDGEGEGGNGRENTTGDGHDIGRKLRGGKERKYGRLNRNKG